MKCAAQQCRFFDTCQVDVSGLDATSEILFDNYEEVAEEVAMDRSHKMTLKSSWVGIGTGSRKRKRMRTTL